MRTLHRMRAVWVGFLVLAAFTVSAQTEFKQKVWIIEKGNTKSLEGDNEVVALQIFELKRYTVLDTTVFPKGATLTTSKEAQQAGLHYAAEEKHILTEDSLLVRKVAKAKAEVLALPPGRYKANIHTVKDSVLINFWIPQYYYASDSVRRGSFIHPNTTYFTKLQNREALVFPYTLWEMSAITVPFKYHPGIEQEGEVVDPQIHTDINVNLYVGYRGGSVKYIYDKYKGMQQRSWGVSVGGFLGLSTRTIDSTASSLHEEPLTSATGIPVVSYGAGMVFDIRDFNLGVFAGWDNGIGKAGNRWNFDNRPWFGIGLGYQLALLTKL